MTVLLILDRTYSNPLHRLIASISISGHAESVLSYSKAVESSYSKMSIEFERIEVT